VQAVQAEQAAAVMVMGLAEQLILAAEAVACSAATMADQAAPAL
jgi:hypothetical protein